MAKYKVGQRVRINTPYYKTYPVGSIVYVNAVVREREAFFGGSVYDPNVTVNHREQTSLYFTDMFLDMEILDDTKENQHDV